MIGENKVYEDLRGDRRANWGLLLIAAVILAGLGLVVQIASGLYIANICVAGVLVPIAIAVFAARGAAPSSGAAGPEWVWGHIRSTLFRFRTALILLPVMVPGATRLILEYTAQLTASDVGVEPVLADSWRQAAWMMWPGVGLAGHALMAAAVGVWCARVMKSGGRAVLVAGAIMTMYLVAVLLLMLTNFGIGMGQQINPAEVIMYLAVLALPFMIGFGLVKLAGQPEDDVRSQ